MTPALAIAACGPEAAAVVHRLTRAAFDPQRSLDPPSSATRETVERVVDDLRRHGGAVASLDGQPVGCLRFEVEPDHLHVRRVAVLPDHQSRGIGRALMAWAEEEAVRRRLGAVTVGVRCALDGNQAFYRHLGYQVVGAHSHPGYDIVTWVSMRKAVGRRGAGRETGS